MSRPMLGTRRRKITLSFGGLISAAGRGEFLWPYSLFTPPQILRRPPAGYGQRKKRGGIGGSPPTKRTVDSLALCLPCRRQETATTHTLTPSEMASFWETSMPVTHGLTPRLFYRPTFNLALRPTGFPPKSIGTYPGTAAFGLASSETRTNGAVPGVRPAKPAPTFFRIPRLRKSPKWPALPATVTQSRRCP